MSASRPAAVAGRFYPDDATELAAVVDEFVATASLDSAAGPAPKAIIAPHAGYPYSGPIAGSAYACVQAAAVERVVMLAPAHRWPVPGLALPASTAFETPLGTVPVDTDAAQRASQFDFVDTIDAAHVEEHAIEVQLPFLQRRLGHVFRLVPFVVGRATTDQVEAVLEELWGGAETLIVISSDLSHLHDYDTAPCRHICSHREPVAPVAAGKGRLRPCVDSGAAERRCEMWIDGAYHGPAQLR